jgi:prevent-host-death family protein
MAETITARDANQHFSRVLREVESGKEFVVTGDGVPVARIVPEAAPLRRRKLTEAQEAALARSMALLRDTDWGPIEHITREQLYDEVLGIIPP